jgi:GNAT superfamily N-acetyltransferase
VHVPVREVEAAGIEALMLATALLQRARRADPRAGLWEAADVQWWWFDATTQVGLVEPVRVEDGFRRRGLARAMLCAGIERLAARGAQRVKVSYESDAAGALYQDVGFRRTSTATWYRASSG